MRQEPAFSLLRMVGTESNGVELSESFCARIMHQCRPRLFLALPRNCTGAVRSA